MLFSRMRGPAKAEDAGEGAEQRDREHGHGDRGRDGHAHLQHQIERRGPEDDAQHGPHQHRRPGELGQDDMVGDIGSVAGGRLPDSATGVLSVVSGSAMKIPSLNAVGRIANPSYNVPQDGLPIRPRSRRGADKISAIIAARDRKWEETADRIDLIENRKVRATTRANDSGRSPPGRIARRTVTRIALANGRIMESDHRRVLPKG